MNTLRSIPSWGWLVGGLAFVGSCCGFFCGLPLLLSNPATPDPESETATHDALVDQVELDLLDALTQTEAAMPTTTPTATVTATPIPSTTPTATDTPEPTRTNTPVPLPTWTPAPIIPTDPPAPQGNCHPAYPTVCIPPPPPDLDCGDISFRRFQVLAPDPHRFDGDGDGIGCES